MSEDSMQVFTDLEFTRACEELDEPQVDDWDLFTQTTDIKIYRQYDKVRDGYCCYPVSRTLRLDYKL